MSVTIAEESPYQNDVREMFTELNDELFELTPPEYCYHMTVEEMARPDTTVLVARTDGEAVACGALRRHANRIGEVKRMYTRPKWRGMNIGGKILAEIENLANNENLHSLVLETGDRHPAAWRLYERGGFTRCGAVLDYSDGGYSVFYEKCLIPQLREAGE